MGLYVGGKIGPVGYSKSITGGSTARSGPPMTPEETDSMMRVIGVLGFIVLVTVGIGYLINGGHGAGQAFVSLIAVVLIAFCVGWVLMALCYVLMAAFYILASGAVVVGWLITAVVWLYRKTALLVLWVRVTLAR
jgi:hypothetical protein